MCYGPGTIWCGLDLVKSIGYWLEPHKFTHSKSTCPNNDVSIGHSSHPRDFYSKFMKTLCIAKCLPIVVLQFYFLLKESRTYRKKKCGIKKFLKNLREKNIKLPK